MNKSDQTNKWFRMNNDEIIRQMIIDNWLIFVNEDNAKSLLQPSSVQQKIQSCWVDVSQSVLKLAKLICFKPRRWHGANAHSFLILRPSGAGNKIKIKLKILIVFVYYYYPWKKDSSGLRLKMYITIFINSSHTTIVCLVGWTMF